MAIPKVMGIETEYGITVKNQPDFNPILSSLLLINSYETFRSSRVRWDYEAESPLRDARGFEYMEEKEGTSKEESRLINLILSNGARFYVDHAHPEYSSPRRRIRATSSSGTAPASGSSISRRQRAEAVSPPEQRILIYKNNTDSKGNSYGTHENYLMDRKVPFARIVQHMMPFFVSRQVFTGAGKVGAENNADRVRLPDLAARRLPRDRSRSRDHALAPDHQHARRAARRSGEVPPPARHRRRRQHERGLQLPQGRHDGDRAEHGRGRLHRARPLGRRPGGRLPRGVARPHLPGDVPAQGRPQHHRRRPAARVPGTGAPLLSRPRGRALGARGARALGVDARPAGRGSDAARPRARLGHQAPAHRELHGQARPGVERLARGR